MAFPMLRARTRLFASARCHGFDRCSSGAEVREALHAVDPVWDDLFPAEQARLVQLLVERVDVGLEGIAVRLRIDGLSSIAHDTTTREALAA